MQSVAQKKISSFAEFPFRISVEPHWAQIDAGTLDVCLAVCFFLYTGFCMPSQNVMRVAWSAIPSAMLCFFSVFIWNNFVLIYIQKPNTREILTACLKICVLNFRNK